MPAQISIDVPEAVSFDLGTVTLRSVHPASPVLLTKNDPLGNSQGLAHFEDVALLVFQAIALLRREKAQEWVFHECQGLCDTAFRFKDKETLTGYCSSVRQRWLFFVVAFVLFVCLFGGGGFSSSCCARCAP